MDKVQARYCVRLNWGYRVELDRKYTGEWGDFWEDIEAYDAGNSIYDSQVFGSPCNLDRNTLMRYARQTAREMLIKVGYPKGKILYDGDILPK